MSDTDDIGGPEDTLPQGSTYEPPQANAADENQIDVATVQAKRREDQDKADLREILTSQAGRRFVYRLLDICDMMSIGDVEPLMLQRAEGRRWVGAQILNILKSNSLSTYPELLLERAAQVAIDERERAAALHKRTSNQEIVD